MSGMGAWINQLLAVITARRVVAIFSAYSLAITAALYETWEILKAGPWPLQALAILAASSCLLWILALLAAFLNSPRVPGQAPRSILWHKLPLRKISWDFEGYLGYGRLMRRPLAVMSFQARYKVNWGEGIVPRKAYIQCRRTQTYFDALTDPGNELVKAEDAKFIPRGRWHSCHVNFGEMLPHDFLTKLDGFWFAFEYDEGKKFSRYFSRSELESYLERGARNMTPSTEPRIFG